MLKLKKIHPLIRAPIILLTGIWGVGGLYASTLSKVPGNIESVWWGVPMVLTLIAFGAAFGVWTIATLIELDSNQY